MKTWNKVVLGLGVAALAAVVLPRASEAALLDTNLMIPGVSVYSATAGVFGRVPSNTVEFSNGELQPDGQPLLRDRDGNPATELHHPSYIPSIYGIGGSTANETMYLVSGTNLFIEYDLGAVWQLDNMFVWNYMEITSRGVQDAEIRYRQSLSDPWTLLGSFTLNQSVNEQFNDWNPPVPQWENVWDKTTTVIPFSGAFARYVRLDGLNNYGDTSFTGLGEAVFTEFIPEPSTGLLLVGGGALLGRARRRRT